MLKANQEQQQAQQQNLVNAEMMRNSPWTGIRPDTTIKQGPNAFTAGVGGGLQGYAFGQGLNESADQNAALKKLADKPATAQQQPVVLAVPQQTAQQPSAWSGMGQSPVLSEGPVMRGPTVAAAQRQQQQPVIVLGPWSGMGH